MSKSKNRNDGKPPLEIINEEQKYEKSFTANEQLNMQDNRKNGETFNIKSDKNLTTNDYHMKTDEDNDTYAIRSYNDVNAIISIIPEHKLLNATEEDVLFQSNVKRLLNQKIKNHISQSFCDRFCIASKSMVRLYKTKEQFLTNSKPTNVFAMTGIKSIKRFFLKGNKSLHFFVIELSDINNKTGKY